MQQLDSSVRRPRRLRLTVAALVLAVLAAGCGDDDDTAADTTVAAPTVTTTAAADTTEGSTDTTVATADTTAAVSDTTAGTVPAGRISIATGGTTGVYYVYGGGLAQVITDNIDGVEATAEVTSASVDNLLLLADGNSDVVFTLADSAADAVNGEGSFEEALDLRALAKLYTNFTQVVTLAGSDVQAFADLAGHRVSVGAPNSGTEVIANRLLEVAGIDVEREQLGLAESVQALRDGQITAFFWSGGLPTGGIIDLTSTDDVRMLDLSELLAPMQAQFGDFYAAAEIPAETYGLDAPVNSIGVANYLVVRADMNDELAFQITKVLFDHQPELEAVHAEAANLDSATATEVEPLELHPGAARYYAEG